MSQATCGTECEVGPDIATLIRATLAKIEVHYSEGTRAAIAALGDTVRMIGDYDTGKAGHAQ